MGPSCQDGPLQAPVLKAALIGMVNNPRHGLLFHQTLLFSAMLPRPAPPFKTGFARSKAKAMDPEIARNQNYDDHYANDSEDVHSALLPFHDDSVRRARSSYVSIAIKLIASFRDKWLGAAEACKYKPFLSPPPISPIAAPSEEQKEHEDNENEIHIFLQNVWWENFPPAHVGAE